MPAPSVANNGKGCGSETAHGRTSCDFVVWGIPMTWRGASLATSNNAWVHLWITPKGNPEVVLFECSAEGFGASCQGDFPDSTTYVELFRGQQTVSLTCWVEGAGTLDYYCETTPAPPS
ncbi:MAG TPA: hypothetical protein VGB83_08550 [Actinomycetota bacterium]